MLMYYSRTLLSRRIERAFACLAAVVFLSHTLTAGESSRSAAQPPAPSFNGLTEQHETLTIGDARTDLTFHVGAAADAGRRLVEITKRALPRLIAWFGPFAANPLTIADVPWTPDARCLASRGRVVVSSRWLQPESDRALERAAIAALARQPFFAIGLGTDDGFVEGMARYAAVRAINETLEGSHPLIERFFGGFVPHRIRAIELSRRPWDTRPFVTRFDGGTSGLPCVADSDDRTRIDARAHDVMVALLSLERAIGWSANQAALATLFGRFNGRTPGAADLVAIVSEQQGSAPAGLLVAALAGHVDVDFAIDHFSTERNARGGTYRTSVRMRRTSPPAASTEPAWPVPLAIHFADGTVVRERLTEPRDEVSLEYQSPSPAVLVAIDPDAVLLFDADRRNNVRAMAPRLPMAGLRRLLNWLVWLQDAALTGTALV
jgi:hypothetical protein